MWSSGASPSQVDTHGKELVFELKAHTCKLHITGTPFGRENSNRAWEHHVHAGGVISDSTKQEYVQKLTSWLLLPAQLDAQGKGPARLMYAMEGSNGSKSVLQAKRAKVYSDAYKEAIANHEVGDVRKSIPVLKCLLDFAIAEVLKTSSTQPKKYCTIVFQQCPMEAGNNLLSNKHTLKPFTCVAVVMVPSLSMNVCSLFLIPFWQTRSWHENRWTQIASSA